MRLEDCHVGVAGVGLIGGSIAAALLRRGAVSQITGWDREGASLDLALEKGILTGAASTPQELVSDVDILILALPIRDLVPVSRELLPLAGEGLKAVFDVASVRACVGEDLADIWGERHMGFHPMAGKEKGGVANASADLFEEATVVLIPSEGTAREVPDLGRELASGMGARSIVLDGEKHDEIVACVSHLPMLVASALSLVAGERMEDLPDLPALAAGGFRDTTRVASGPAWLVSDVKARNGQAIGAVLDRLITLLQVMGEASPDEIERLAEKARDAREAVLAGVSRRWTS